MSVSNGDSEEFGPKPRWLANRKIDVVLRLPRGESIEDVSREIGVEVHGLAAWRATSSGVGEAGVEVETS
jgi:hypothetical protein